MKKIKLYTFLSISLLMPLLYAADEVMVDLEHQSIQQEEDIDRLVGQEDLHEWLSLDEDLDAIYSSVPGDRDLIARYIDQELKKNPSAVPAAHRNSHSEQSRFQRLISITRILGKTVEELHADGQMSKQEAQEQRERADRKAHVARTERARKIYSCIAAAAASGWAIISTVWGIVEFVSQNETLVSVICNSTMPL